MTRAEPIDRSLSTWPVDEPGRSASGLRQGDAGVRRAPHAQKTAFDHVDGAHGSNAGTGLSR